MSQIPAISLEHLCKTYSNGVRAVQDLSLTVQAGDFFALLGPNGAGKSTTIGILSTLVEKTSGRVLVHGADLDQQKALVKQQIGLVPQEFNFNIFETVFDICVTQAGYFGVPRAKAKARAEFLLKKLSLWDKRREIAMRLSGGMKRRLMVARAMMHEPHVLILDEPTAGVDIEIRRSMWAFLQELNQSTGTTIILTTHYLEEVEQNCRHVAIIQHGRIVKNTSVRALLGELTRETMVLDLRHALPVLAYERVQALPGYTTHALDETTLEVSFERDQGLMRLFEALRESDNDVMSMRPKANRLETLFMHMVEEKTS